MANSSIAQFKISNPGGLTRRLVFLAHPTWAILSSKISATFGIPTDNVGVSYLDQDGDEVTLSSDEELQDYYSTLGGDKYNPIRLSVQDLSSLRSTNVAPSRNLTAPPSHFRNTFGEHDSLPFVFEVDDEWQRLPGSLGNLFLSSDSPESPHAFVEVLESDVSGSKKSDNADEEFSVGDITRSDVTFTMPTFRTDKGKSRIAMQPTVEDDVSSTDSVFGDDAPPQPQARVYDSDEASTFGVKAKTPVSASGTATPAQAQSTPVISGQVLPEAVLKSTAAFVDDPALPTLDNSNNSSTGQQSLTHDVAAFLKTISGIISSHPELSEGVRNIVANATNGTYWTAHRDALSRAAENIQQETGKTAEEIQNAEEEASARVADALGGIFRTFGDAVQTARTATESFRPPAAQEEFVPVPQCVRPCGFIPYPRPPPGHLPPHPHHRWGPPPPPPPPPPPGRRHGWPRPPPPFWGLPTGRQEEHGPHVDHHGRARMSDIRTTLAEARNRRLGNLGLPTPVNPPPIPNAPAAPPARAVPPHEMQGELSDSSLFRSPSPTQEELRADVERAKADYKMRKERYRQARAGRKSAEHREQRQESSGSNDVSGHPIIFGTVSGADISASQGLPTATPVPEVTVSSSPAPTTAPAPSQPATPAAPQVHIVSNARGVYPQLEMFSVPRRSHTIGHTPRRGPGHHEDRSVNRIMRKLSEMGFTEGTYPKLNAKVTEQMAAHPPTTKDGEDDIVTNLIEELIPSASAPRASGSREPIPGAWA
ncbi:hypothetical protein DEU56DRAFT_768054 [Suillus clintonianus]|uniref:uncharacterized protein n=1 Tax=Suillus clintonianus TaxID=1904413 RepID=UPI001B86DF5F|nr:uncharacterized protein DEU56DRAFT_768054 [Suillus clintonianus]KAG2155568.1 hypothetical protein DEU56DRAFT_768054 [Suillus clintonianus]